MKTERAKLLVYVANQKGFEVRNRQYMLFDCELVVSPRRRRRRPPVIHFITERGGFFQL